MKTKAALVIRVEREQYPNLAWFFAVYLGAERVGGFDEREPGKFLPFGSRKPLSSQEDAAREVLWLRVKRALKDGARFSATLDLPVVVSPLPEVKK